MGGDNVTTLSLKVFNINNNDNILAIRGSVPGINKGVVYIREAVKKGNKGIKK